MAVSPSPRQMFGLCAIQTGQIISGIEMLIDPCVGAFWTLAGAVVLVFQCYSIWGLVLLGHHVTASVKTFSPDEPTPTVLKLCEQKVSVALPHCLSACLPLANGMRLSAPPATGVVLPFSLCDNDA